MLMHMIMENIKFIIVYLEQVIIKTFYHIEYLILTIQKIKWVLLGLVEYLVILV